MWLAGCMGLVRVHAGSLLRSVDSPCHSFCINRPQAHSTFESYHERVSSNGHGRTYIPAGAACNSGIGSNIWVTSMD